jgi:hypothetical protein
MLPDRLRRMPVLPRRRLFPLLMLSPNTRRWLREEYDAAPSHVKIVRDAMRRASARFDEATQPARAQSTRLRLTACHWAGAWRFLFISSALAQRGRAARARPLWQGPKWLGSKRPGKPAVWPRGGRHACR